MRTKKLGGLLRLYTRLKTPNTTKTIHESWLPCSDPDWFVYFLCEGFCSPFAFDPKRETIMIRDGHIDMHMDILCLYPTLPRS
jgi:hypothetical protein